jgi:homocitrate synthase NifV
MSILSPETAASHTRAWLIDTTLRDGEQAPGVCFSTAQRFAIAHALANAGIDEIEAGTVAMGPTEQSFLAQLNAQHLPCRVSCWCRARSEDISAALRCGCTAIHISTPLNHLHRSAPRSLSEHHRITQLISYAADNANHVSVGVLDALRTPPGLIERFARSALQAGAYRLRLADTVGTASPAEVSYLMRTLKKKVPGIALEFHGHNDMGMATANALTALQSGAEAVSVTVNGLGERAGNTSLEQLVMALSRHMPSQLRFNSRQLQQICLLVSHFSRREIPPHAPVCGSAVFTHESGIHCNDMYSNPSSFEPWDPQQCGHSPSQMVLGKHSGSTTLQQMLGKCGITVSREEARTMLPAVRRIAQLKNGSLSSSELHTIYRSSLIASTAQSPAYERK